MNEQSFIEKLGPLRTLFEFTLLALFLFAANRLLLALVYQPELSFWEFIKLWPIGLRIDTILLSMVMFVPVCLALLVPNNLRKFSNAIIVLYLTLAGTLFVHLEIATLWYMGEYSARPNQFYFQYLSHPGEVFGMIWKSMKLPVFVMAVILAIVIPWLWRNTKYSLKNETHWNQQTKLLVFPVALLLLVFGARSGFNMAAPNISLAAYSNSYVANQIALNSSYSLMYSAYRYTENSSKSEDLFGTMPEEEIVKRVRKYMLVDENEFTDAKRPTLHKQIGTTVNDTPKNLVIILMEGMGYDTLRNTKGINVAPVLEQLGKQGISFDNLYSTGIRTYRGVEAVVSGYPPPSYDSTALKLDLAQHDFFSIAALLKNQGYFTSFFYGGESHFDNMASYLLGNGFDKLFDKDDFPDAEFTGVWGASDEDVFRAANDYFKTQQQPFASVILTLSHHSPFDFPQGKFNLVTEPVDHPLNAARYADYAIGKFFDIARPEKYFDNTVFVLVADHPRSIEAIRRVPIDRYQIPAVILGPNVPQMNVTALTGQLDVLPTALHFIGLDLTHPMIGNNMMLAGKSYTGSAIMQYQENMAFAQGNRVVMFVPYQERSAHLWNRNKLIDMDLDPELEKDALAHILFPGLAYEKGYYKFPLLP
ncbi:MAG: LTA synthase family protein [Gammaproteobacteria bacterium]|nr:LTA synthase family protein [Gammaproteobacteria bacterium]